MGLLYQTIKPNSQEPSVVLPSLYDVTKQIEPIIKRQNQLIEQAWKAQEEAKKAEGNPLVVGSNLAIKAGKGIVKYGQEAFGHPKEVFKGVAKTAVLKPIEFIEKTLTGKVGGKTVDEILGKAQTPDEEKARAVGEFLGWMVPYSLIAKGIKTGLTVLQLAPKVAKYIPIISDAIGFVGTGQVLHEEGSRLEQMRNDIIVLGVFKGAGKAYSLIKNKAIGRAVDETATEFKAIVNTSRKETVAEIGTMKDIQQRQFPNVNLREGTQLERPFYDIKPGINIKPKVDKLEAKIGAINDLIKTETGKSPKQHIIEDIKTEIPPKPQPIAQEVTKYKSAEEFVQKRTDEIIDFNAKQAKLTNPQYQPVPSAKELTNFYNQTTKGISKAEPLAQEVGRVIPKELQPLALEAQKYKSAEEFTRAFQSEIKHGEYWHITDNPKFTIDTKLGPRDMSSLAGGKMDTGKLMVTSDINYWSAEYPSRKFAAKLDFSAVRPEDYYQVNRGFGNEFFVKDPSKVKVIKVIPIENAIKEHAQFQKILGKTINSKQALTDFYNQATKGVKPLVQEAVKPLPEGGRIIKPEIKITPKTETIKVPSSQLPVGEGELRVSRLQARLSDNLGKLSKEEIDKLGLATYNEMKDRSQLAKTIDYVEKNTEDALAVLEGKKEAPRGMLRNSIFVVMNERVTGDRMLAEKLTTLASTRFGQEIQILSQLNPHSPVRYMTNLVNRKIEIVGGKERVASYVKEKVTKPIQEIFGVKGRIKNNLVKFDLESFVRSIKC